MVMSSLVGSVTNAARQPDLSGNMFPVPDELDVAALPVTGTLPAGLRGSFVRNGPNLMFEPLGRYHMFDGDGMLHGVTISDGRVSYRNRWVRSRGLAAEVAHGRSIYPGLGNVMDFPDRSLTGDAGPVKNPANTHIIRHAGRWLALWEGGLPTEVTPELDTVGEYDFGGRLRGSMTAHPRLDPRTGELFFVSYSLFAPYLRYHVVDASGALVHSAELDLPAPVMMHDFVTTEEHAVFLDSPIVFNMETLGQGPMVSWRPENGTRIGVMPLRGGNEDIRWFEIEPGHVQHFWGGCADGDRIVLAGSRFEAPEFGIDPNAPLDQSAASNDPPRPARFWVDLVSGDAGWEQIDDLGGDFNRINDDYNGVYT
jgi:carotenoid cleavage dioxygenase